MNYITIPAVLGPILGPSVGGFIVTYFSWPWIFFINLPIGMLGVLLVRIFIPDIARGAGPRVRSARLHADRLGGRRPDLRLRGDRARRGAGFDHPGIDRGRRACAAALYLIHARRTTDPIIDLQPAADPDLRGLDLGRRPVLSGHDLVGLPAGAAAATGLRILRLSGRAHDARERGRARWRCDSPFGRCCAAWAFAACSSATRC